MKFSIITVCKNSESTIERTILSIKNQTYPNIEHIVIDGASTDHTLSLIQKYASDISVLISEPDNGIYDAMNKGIAMANGDIIGICNADDWYEHDAMETVYQTFCNYPGLHGVHGDMRVHLNSDTHRLYTGKRFLPGWVRAPFNHPTCFFRRSVYDEIGSFNTRYRTASDLDFMLRYQRAGFQTRYIPRVLSNFTTGGVSRQGLLPPIRQLAEILTTNGYSPLHVVLGIEFRIMRRMASALKTRIKGTDQQPYLPRVLSIHNLVDNGNIPAETFFALSPEEFSLNLFSFKQTNDELTRFMSEQYTEIANRFNLLGGAADKNQLIAFFRMAAHLIFCKYDIVHSHHVATAALTNTIVGGTRRLTGRHTQRVVTVHNDFAHFQWHQKMWLTIALANSDAIIYNSENTQRSVLRELSRIVSDKRSRVIYNGINFSRIPRRVHTATDTDGKDSFKIGFAGRLVKQKNLTTLIRGFKIVLDTYPNATLTVIGSGNQQPVLENLVTSLKIQGHIQFPGEYSRSETYRALPGFDVIVIPSLWEGFCNAMVEAIACDIPVVASDLRILKEVAGKKNIHFFIPSSPQSLADALVKVLQNPAGSRRLAAKARRYVLSRYSLDVCANNYSRFYRMLLNR